MTISLLDRVDILTFLLQGLFLGLSAAATPGPFQIFMISQSLNIGWRRTLPAVLAPLLSDGPIILLMTVALVHLPPGVLNLIRIVGGLYVLYLGWKAIQSYRYFQLVVPDDETRKTVWQAIVTNLLSPGPYIFWSMLAGPVLVRGWQEDPAYGLIFLFGFYLAMIGGSALLVVVFGAARQLGPRLNRALIGLAGLALIGFGLYQLWQGVV